LIATTYNSGFEQAHDTYNGMLAASNGKIYYVLCSELHDIGAQMYEFDPAGERITHLGDLTAACGEKGQQKIVQGKSHVNFVESDGRLYFATHIGFYNIKDGKEMIGTLPSGFKPYPGGHLLAYDLAARRFEDLAVSPNYEGILAMNMDARRGRMYGLTWPSGHFLRYDLTAKTLKDFGPVSARGEAGEGADYRTLCRCIAVDPDDGTAYFTVSTGEIRRYRCDRDTVETVEGDDLRKDYFGLYDPAAAGHMGYNWRQVIWHPDEKVFYGMHGNSGYLFTFDPRASHVELLERITSEPSRRSGMFDQFSYGYLGFSLGPDRRTLYYLTGAPLYVDGRRVTGKSETAKGESKGEENLHLVTYDIPSARRIDHGPIFLQNGDRPAYVNSIAIGKDGTVYALSRITENEHTRTDLIRIAPVSLRSHS
jgi:hypothetical protein